MNAGQKIRLKECVADSLACALESIDIAISCIRTLKGDNPDDKDIKNDLANLNGIVDYLDAMSGIVPDYY